MFKWIICLNILVLLETTTVMLDYLNKGYYDDKRDEARDSYSKVFHRSCDDF